MRLILMCSAMIVLALPVLTAFPASAQKAEVKERYHYTTCSCRFGYGGSCVSALACTIEGGRCSGPCTPTPEFEVPDTNSGAPSAQRGR